jgi:hypothetical protein
VSRDPSTHCATYKSLNTGDGITDRSKKDGYVGRHRPVVGSTGSKCRYFLIHSTFPTYVYIWLILCHKAYHHLLTSFGYFLTCNSPTPQHLARSGWVYRQKCPQCPVSHVKVVIWIVPICMYRHVSTQFGLILGLNRLLSLINRIWTMIEWLKHFYFNSVWRPTPKLFWLCKIKVTSCVNVGQLWNWCMYPSSPCHFWNRWLAPALNLTIELPSFFPNFNWK